MRAVALVLALALSPALAGCLEAQLPQAPVPAEGERITEHVTTDPGWPSADEAPLRPGILIEARSRTCPSNFLFARPDNTSLFLGLAAHCVQDMRVGEFVLLDPGRTDAPAMIIYHSWQTMAELGIEDAVAWDYNDFAVVRIDPDHRDLVHPALLRYGGPVAAADVAALPPGARLVTYADAPPGEPDAGARHALLARHDTEWGLLAYAVPPGLPGRLGSGVLTPDGHAVGLVVSLGVAPNPGANGIARLDKVTAFAREHANLDMDLLTWDALAPLTPLAAPAP